MLTVERYARTRFWGLYENRQLLCVTVYKKGANAVKARIEGGVPLAAPAPLAPLPESLLSRGHARRKRVRVRY